MKTKEEMTDIINERLSAIESMAQTLRFNKIATDEEYHAVSREIIREAQYVRYLVDRFPTQLERAV